MKIIEKIFGAEDSNKEINSILERGKGLLEKNFYDWAAVEFNKALELDTEFASATITKLFQEMQGGGNPDGIISLGINVLKMNPKNLDLANLLGNTYRKKLDWNRAKNMYKHCLKLDPNHKHAVYNLAATIAKAQIADGQAVSAVSEFEKMTEFVLPEIKEGMEKLNEIQKKIPVIQNNDNDGELIERDKNQKKDDGENEENSETADKKDENHNINKVPNSDEEQKNDEESTIDPIQTFEYITSKLSEKSDEEKEVCFSLGIYCLITKEGKTAQKVFKHLLMKDKENTDLRCFLVLAISLEGDVDNAIKTLQNILGRNPTHRYTNVNMGILLKNKGHVQQARVCFFNTFKLLECSQGEYEINTCLEKADKLFNENREKKALEIYEPLVNEISSQKLLLRIAKLNLDNKSWDNALEIFRRILRMNRQNEIAREGIKSIYKSYLIESEDYIKKKDPKNAAERMDKALNIALSKNLLQKAISINHLVENENRAIELEKTLDNFIKKELNTKIQEKIEQAKNAEKKGNYKDVIHYFEQAIRIKPQNTTLKQMVDFCARIKRPDLAEKLSNWFFKLQQSAQEKEKSQAREKFELFKKNEEKNKGGS